MRYLEEARRALRERRSKKEERAYLLLTELRKNPEFSEAERKLDSLRFDAAKQKALNDGFGKPNDEIREAEREFSEVLARLGHTNGELFPPPDCARCGDRLVLPDGAVCGCVKAEAKRIARESVNRPTDSETEFPTSYPGFSEEDGQKNRGAAKLVERWTAAFPNLAKPCLVLTGKTGVGKSRLASVAANVLNERDFTALFLNAQRLNDLFLEDYLAPLSEKRAALAPVFDADLLVIDDLGAESFLQKVTAEYLYTLLSIRAGRPLIVTTNLSPEGVLSRYGERVFSRLYDRANSLTIELAGSDLRLRSDRK